MKKMSVIFLAVVLIFGMSGVASAASLGKITGVTSPITTQDLSDLEIAPGKVYEFPLTADMFEWSDGDGGSSDPVTETQITAGKIAVKAKYSGKSKNYVESLELTYKKASVTKSTKTAHVRLEFVDSVAATDEVKFSLTIYLTKSNSRQSDSEIDVSGVLTRPLREVYADDGEEYVDISSGELAQSDGFIRDMEFYIGNGVILRANMYENKKYYGTCDDAITEDDSKVLDAYPEIDGVYRISSNITNGKVRFELDDTRYIYDESGKFVGTTDEDLAFSKTYYLAVEKINIKGTSSSSSSSSDDDDEHYYEVDDGSSDSQEAVPTPDDESGYYYGSINDNPSTGAGRGLAVALTAAGLAGLAVIFASRRGKNRKI